MRGGPKPGTLQRVSMQILLHKRQHLSPQLCIWVLIVLQHTIYVKYTEWCPHLSRVSWFVIGSIFVESLWKTSHFEGILSLFHSNWININLIANRRLGDESGHQTAYCMYRLCCDMMRNQILNLRGSCRTCKMEPRSGSNWALNPAVSGAVRVTTRTWACSPGANPDCSRVTRHHC
jgi:hypothetical protein